MVTIINIDCIKNNNKLGVKNQVRTKIMDKSIQIDHWVEITNRINITFLF